MCGYEMRFFKLSVITLSFNKPAEPKQIPTKLLARKLMKKHVTRALTLTTKGGWGGDSVVEWNYVSSVCTKRY